MDEAAQSLEPEALIPLALARPDATGNANVLGGKVGFFGGKASAIIHSNVSILFDGIVCRRELDKVYSRVVVFLGLGMVISLLNSSEFPDLLVTWFCISKGGGCI